MTVVVANQPRLLKECIAAHGEVEAASSEAIVRSVERHKPDCLILSLETRDASPRICRTVFSQYPYTLILAVGPKTLTVYWYEIIVCSECRECSLQSILDLLRVKACTAEKESAVVALGEHPPVNLGQARERHIATRWPLAFIQ